MNSSKRPTKLWGLAAASLGLLAGALCVRPLPGYAAPAAANHPWLVAQEDMGEAEQVKPEEVEKYIKVYQAMQHNRRMTVAQAAAAQHLTVAQFRDIERRIERNGTLRERVRRALLQSAEQQHSGLKPSPAGSASPH